MLSALSPKYPALYDEESKVFFKLGKAEVTEEQAELLAQRPFRDGILIGEFDEERRTVGEMPAKEWARARRRAQAGPDPDSADAGGGEPASESTSEATTVAKNNRSK